MPIQQKIDQWIKEAEERPASALSILRLIANRLRDLSARDEELLAENIALQDGSRVEEYQQRIAHLEYQLDLLKRRFGPAAFAVAEAAMQPAPPQSVSLLLYHPNGRVLRQAVPPAAGQTPPAALAHLAGELAPGNELPRLLAVSSEEELLLLFSSGRVSTCPVADISPSGGEGVAALTWESGSLPDEPHGGEHLSALIPLTALPLSDFVLQVSRRACVKKTIISMTGTILSNHFIGRGTLQKADQPFEALLCQKQAVLALVTYEGRLLALDVDDLTYSAEERLRLEPHDHVVAAFAVAPDQSLLCLTQTGKVIHREAGSLEPARSANTRGQALISPARLDQGTRFIGAAALRQDERVLVLDGTGSLDLYAWSDLKGAGALPEGKSALSLAVLPPALQDAPA